MMARKHAAGFTLIEMMITMLVLSIIMAAIFSQMIGAMRNSTVEQAKLDLFQESREFMDQLTRDLHNSGYPNPRNLAASQNGGNIAQQANVAVGLVKVDSGDLWFEGDVIGDGQVYLVRYTLDTTGPNCPCLKRSWQLKQQGVDPLTTFTDTDLTYEVEVQNVLNGTPAYPLDSHPIFSAYYVGDPSNPATLPVDTNGNIATINTIKVNLTVQAKITDPVTRLAPTATLESTIRLNNCEASQAGTMECN